MRISDYKAVLAFAFFSSIFVSCGIYGLEDYFWEDKLRDDPTLSFAIDSGFFDSVIELELSTEDERDLIYYSLDGSPPYKAGYSIISGGDISTSTPGSLVEYTGGILYEEPITISATAMVKAVVYKNDLFPGEIISNTYFINETTALPIFSISADPADFFDDYSGIYVKGNNPNNIVRPNYEKIPPYNFMQDWEKEISFEYFDENRDLIMEMNAGVKIFGGWSRLWPDQKSLALFAREKYGSGVFSYPFFGNSLVNDLGNPIDEFSSILLRTSGDDWYRTMFRDASLQKALDGMDVDRQAYQPSIVFLNGEFWGIHNIREKINEDYLAAHYSYVNPDEVDILESYDSRVVEGSNSDFLALIDYVENNDLSVAANYSYVQTKIDLSNFIDYFVSQIYFNNTDWPFSNIKYWKPQGGGGKWRWLTYDLDGSFGGKEWLEDEDPPEIYNRATTDTMDWVLDEDGSTDSATLFAELMDNSDFRNQFKTRMQTLMGSNFSVANMESIFAGNKAVIDPEVVRQDEKWGNLWDYTNKYNALFDFAQDRHDYVSNLVGGHTSFLNKTTYFP